MATCKQMSTTFKYDWGQAVRVATTAPVNIHPGRPGSVCGMREVEGRRVYLIEFSDGQAIEISEDFLEAMKDE